MENNLEVFGQASNNRGTFARELLELINQHGGNIDSTDCLNFGWHSAMLMQIGHIEED